MIKLFKDVHWPVLLLAAGISLSSIFFIYSATFRGSDHFILKQLMWVGISLTVMWLVVSFGYRTFLNASYLLYGISILLLIGVLIFGHERLGAQRWFQIGSFVLQPSELSKIATILALAHFLFSRNRWSAQKRSLLIAGGMVALPFLLILKQPDLGSAMVFIAITIAILLVWGVRLRYLAVMLSLAIISAPFLWHGLKPYQQKRLTVFLNPSVDPLGSGYTAIQSKIAVGSGGLIGKGWLQGTQTQLDFVPEHHTDFIFCVIGEEFGFLGALLLILLYAALIGYAIQIMERTTDRGAQLLAAGISAMLFFQIFINIGMTIGIAPITGITLPLISYGGSSLLATFIAIGFLISIYKERSIF